MSELELINRIIAILGEEISAGAIRDWLEVKENAERLREEGHNEN